MTERFSDRHGYRAEEQEISIREDGWNVLVIRECEFKADGRLPKRPFHFLDGVPAA